MQQSLSAPYTPLHNTIAVRVDETLFEAALVPLIQTHLPRCLWPFSLKHVISIRNEILHSTTGIPPFSILINEQSSLNHIRVSIMWPTSSVSLLPLNMSRKALQLSTFNEKTWDTQNTGENKCG